MCFLVERANCRLRGKRFSLNIPLNHVTHVLRDNDLAEITDIDGVNGEIAGKTKGGCGYTKSCMHRGATISGIGKREKGESNDQISPREKQVEPHGITSLVVSE